MTSQVQPTATLTWNEIVSLEEAAKNRPSPRLVIEHGEPSPARAISPIYPNIETSAAASVSQQPLPPDDEGSPPLELRPLCAGLGYAAPSSLEASFQAFQDNNTSIPPDTMGAVGPNHLVVMLNSRVRIQTRAGAQVSSVSLTTFWSTVASSPFDPHVMFDALSGRWIATVVSNSRSASSKVCLAVSATDDPTGSWTFSQLDADASDVNWADFPGLGVNQYWITITANMYPNVGSTYIAPKMWVMDKSSALSGGAISVTAFGLGFDNTGAGSGFTLQPTVSLDRLNSEMFIVDSGWTDSSNGEKLLRVSRLTGYGASPSWTTLSGTFSNPAYGVFKIPASGQYSFSPPPAPQLGDSRTFEIGSSRVQTAILRGGRITLVHMGGIPTTSPTRSGVAWHQFNPANLGSPWVHSSVLDGGPGVWLAYPSIAVNCAGDIVTGFSQFGADRYAQAAYSLHLASDLPNAMSAPTVLKAGESTYYKDFGGGRNRWGDYSATMVDPVDDATFWTIQEYAAARVGPADNDSRFGVWWAKIGQQGCPFPWQERLVGALPSPRAEHGAAFDSLRNALVVFGGNISGDRSGETWEWDGSAWTLVSTSGPSARKNVMMAYDSFRNKTVLFGGVDANGTRNDTWEWNGSIWTPVQIPGSIPSARRSGSMCFDSNRNRMVLFSGEDGAGGVLGDTWEYNGTSWTQFVGAGPSPRYTSALAFDSSPGRNVTVMFGGFGAGSFKNETWEWNGSAWTRRFPANPPPVRAATSSMAFDAVRNKCVLFGGFDSAGVPPSDCWEYDGNNWVQKFAAIPPSRYGNTTVFDSSAGRVLVFGGAPDGNNVGPKFSDLWSFDGTRWLPVAGPAPSPRYGGSMTYSASLGGAVYFGGFRSSPDSVNETWLRTPNAWGRLDAPTYGPSPLSTRGQAAIAYDSSSGRIYIHGGLDGASNVYNDTWVLVPEGEWFVQPQGLSTPPRYDAASCYYASVGSIIIFGGANRDPGVLGDARSMRPCCNLNWELMPGTPPPGRQGAAMAYDPVRDEAILFGGRDGNNQPLHDTWRLKYVAGQPVWTYVQVPIMGTLNNWKSPSMVWNPARQRLVLFGAQQSGFEIGATVSHQVWEWDGQTWVPIDGPAPSLREYQNLAATSANGDLTLFGGRSLATQASFGDTYLYNGPTNPTIDAPITGGGAAACGSNVNLALTSVGGVNQLGLQYRWGRNNAYLTNGVTPYGSTISGTLTSTLTISNFRPADAGVYFCNVSNACSPTAVGATTTVSVGTCCIADTDNGLGTGVPDGGVGIEDLLYYLAEYDAGSLRADVDDGAGGGVPDAGVGIEDLLYYLQRYDAGC